MIYCFDTSALNWLLDDSDREAIIAGILASASVRITAYNVLETAKMKEEGSQRRNALIKLMRQLGENKRPLDRPNTILLSYATAHARKAKSATVNADPNLEGVWVALNQPESIDEDARQEALQWAQSWDGDFDKAVSTDRDKFQDLFRQQPQERPHSPAVTFRSYLKHPDEIFSGLVKPIYERQTGKVLSRQGFDSLMIEPVWCLYLIAYAYGLHQRSAQRESYSRDKNPGGIDLSQAVYLTLCDCFVTADYAQYRALRWLNVFNTKRRTTVLQYKNFRRRLVLAG